MRHLNRRRAIAGIGVLTALMLIVGACSGPPSTSVSPDDPTSSTATATDPVGSAAGGTATVAVFSDTKGFDPAVVDAGPAGGDFAVNVFGSLLRLEPDGTVGPALASAMTTDDGVVWTMTIRPGITFTDGTPLDAAAVDANLQRHLAPDSRSTARGLLSSLESVTVVDDLTIRFVLDGPRYSFPQLFTQAAASGFVGSPTALAADPAGFNSNPVGAGPYRLVRWTPDDSIVFERNEGYSGPPAGLDRITYRIIPDPQSRADALLSGDVDVAYLLPANLVGSSTDRPDLAPLLDGNPGGIGLALNMQRAPGDDDRVRRAIRLAFDPQATNAVFFPGGDLWSGSTACLPWADDAPECDPVSSPAPDPATASALIAEYAAEGNSTAIELIGTANYQRQLEYMQQVLTTIGLQVELSTTTTTEWVSRISEGDYAATLLVTRQFRSFYPQAYFLLSERGRNYPKQQDTAFEEAMLRGVDGATPADRVAGWHDMQRIFHDRTIATWVAPFTEFTVVNRDRLEMPGYIGGLQFEPWTWQRR